MKKFIFFYVLMAGISSYLYSKDYHETDLSDEMTVTFEISPAGTYDCRAIAQTVVVDGSELRDVAITGDECWNVLSDKEKDEVIKIIDELRKELKAMNSIE